MTDLVPTAPPVPPEIVGIAQISASQAPSLPPGKYYFAYARNIRISQWPKFAISDLGPALEVITSNSFNAVDIYDNPETAGPGAQPFHTLYMTDNYPGKNQPVHWKAVNTIGSGDPESKKLLTVALLSSQGVYDAASLNDILQANNIISNTIHTEGHSTAATGPIQITPVGIDIKSFWEAGPQGGGWGTVVLTFGVLVALLLLFWLVTELKN